LALQEFLAAQVPDEEAGSARFGNRNIQVDYFIGLAHEALKDQKKAKQYFEKAASVEISGRSSIMNYYQGLSLLELKNKKKAKEVFDALVVEGDKRLSSESGESGEFFAIFGERDAESTRKSMAYTLRGLGHKGNGESAKAEADLGSAVELSAGNLWARTELNL